jgi:hypothetical protein
VTERLLKGFYTSNKRELEPFSKRPREVDFDRGKNFMRLHTLKRALNKVQKFKYFY